MAYNFQRRFEAPIVAGTKMQTIRAAGKRRHAQPGEFVGMRRKHCRMIATATCWANQKISISFEHFVVQIGEPGSSAFVRYVGIDEATIANLLDPFARNDGFADFSEMSAFWKHQHGIDDFHGRVISWRLVTLRGGADGLAHSV